MPDVPRIRIEIVLPADVSDAAIDEAVSRAAIGLRKFRDAKAEREAVYGEALTWRRPPRTDTTT